MRVVIEPWRKLIKMSPLQVWNASKLADVLWKSDKMSLWGGVSEIDKCVRVWRNLKSSKREARKPGLSAWKGGPHAPHLSRTIYKKKKETPSYLLHLCPARLTAFCAVCSFHSCLAHLGLHCDWIKFWRVFTAHLSPVRLPALLNES